MSQEQSLAQYKRYVAENPDDREGARRSYYDTFGVDPEERLANQAGAVSKQARKNLASIEAQKTNAQAAQDTRDIRSQYIRDVFMAPATALVGVATGGLGLVPAAGMAAGTAAAGEAAAQASSISETPGTDIALAGALGGLSEFGGRFIAGSIAKVAAKRAAAKAVPKADYADLAEKLGFPTKNVEGRAGTALQARVDAARRVAVTKEVDEIFKPYGSPLTAELSGQEAAGVFKNIESKFVQHARDARKFVTDAFGDLATSASVPISRSEATVNRLRDELGKRAFKGKEDLDVFFSAMLDDKGGAKKFTLDELLALRTDIGKEAFRYAEGNPRRAVLEQLWGAMTQDVESVIAQKNPLLLGTFRQANSDFNTYFKAMKNEVASRLMNEANAGNGVAVVKEFFKGDPADINHVLQFVQKTRPQDMGAFRKTIQRAALQNIFGVAEDGAPVMGHGLAERMAKLGPDKLELIFGGSKEAMETLGRVRELAKLTGSFERSLKIPADMSRQLDAGVKRLVVQGGVALAAKAWGAPYAAARIGASVLKDAGDIVMAELVSRPDLFRKFTEGWKRAATAVSSSSLVASTRASLSKQGEALMKGALAGAANGAAFKLSADAKRKETEAAKAAEVQRTY